MAITKLNTYEGVPLGKENFEGYTTYLSSLTARSNPFITSTATDFNDVIVLGAGQTQVIADSTDADLTISPTVVSLNNNDVPTLFFHKFQDTSFAVSENNYSTVASSSDYNIVSGISSSTVEAYVLYVEVEDADPAVSTPSYGTIQVTTNTPSYSSAVINVSSSDVTKNLYFKVYADNSTVITIDYNHSSGTKGINLKTSLHKVEPWYQDTSYVINYKVDIPLTASNIASTNLNVYYDNIEYLHTTDTYQNLLQTIPIRQNETSLGSILFRPSSDASDTGLIFRLDDDGAEFNIDISVDSYKLSDTNLITLTGASKNSFAFISNDNNELYAISTYLIEDGGYGTPPIDSWEVPLASIEELYYGPGSIGYGFSRDKLPLGFSYLSAGDYSSAKNDTTLGSYSKGFSVVTINGIPQVERDQVTQSSFYSSDALLSSDVFEFTSFRLGAEYPTPRYTFEENPQYAQSVISGFIDIDADKSVSVDGSLANINFDNTLYFPYTDFLLNPTLILIRKDSSGNYTYYYIPQDTDFSSINSVKTNHYKVLDTSSGKIKFNFDLNFPESPTDAYWVVSAEQLSESTTNNVTDYFSSYGKLYYPTANLNIDTILLYFDPSVLINTNFEAELPEIPVVPLNKVITSGGGPLISDAEGEFSGYSMYAISYPGRINADEIVKNQANKYEPDVVTFYYYNGTVADEFVSSEVPYSTYVTISENDISWFNRGINRLTYDPVSRAVRTNIVIAGSENQSFENSALLSDIKRRSTLSAAIGTVGPEDTTFMKPLSSNAFLYSDNTNSITSTQTSETGSLLVGGSPPTKLLLGTEGQVLTSYSGSAAWRDINTNGWNSIQTVQSSPYLANTINASSASTLRIVGSTDHISIESTDLGGSINRVNIALSTDLRVWNLTVSDSVTLPSTGVIAGTYGSSSSVPNITVSADGRISGVTTSSISTNAWSTVTNGSTSATAGSADTLYIRGTDNQINVNVSSSPDTVSISLSSDVFIENSLTAKYLVINTGTTPGSAERSMWTTSSDVSIILNGTIRKFVFLDQLNAGEIVSGTLATSYGGTGQNSYLDEELLFGTSTGNTLFKGKIFTSSPLNKSFNSSSGLTLSLDSSSSNTVNYLVQRDGFGNFSAGTITASLNGNANTATSLQTSRNINTVPFDGTNDITITANTTNALTAGTGISSAGTFNGSTARTFSVDTSYVMTLGTTQTITGTKTFSNSATLVLPVKS